MRPLARPLALTLVAVLLASGCTDTGEQAPTRAGSQEVQVTAPPTTPPRATTPPPPTTPPAPPATAAPAPTPEPLGLPAGLDAVVTDLMTAERTIRDPAAGAAEVAAAGRVHQEAVRALVVQPEWRQPALAQLPEDLREAIAGDVAAGAALRELHRPQSHLPAWRIVPPAPADELLAYYREAEAAFGVPWSVLAAIHLVETRMGRIRGTSNAGAQGPMQFMPATWEAYGEGDVDDNHDAILAAARYLRASGAANDLDGALYAYNRSRRYVTAVRTYADAMAATPARYRGYHAWQVHYMHVDGDLRLPEGWDGSR